MSREGGRIVPDFPNRFLTGVVRVTPAASLSLAIGRREKRIRLRGRADGRSPHPFNSYASA